MRCGGQRACNPADGGRYAGDRIEFWVKGKTARLTRGSVKRRDAQGGRIDLRVAYDVAVVFATLLIGALLWLALARHMPPRMNRPFEPTNCSFMEREGRPYEIRGLAWSGRGRISRVEISTDGGVSWNQAELEGTPEPICTVRFKQPWLWDGKPALLLSRCQDETGYVQPTREKLVAERGLNAYYHYNGIQAWGVAPDGSIANVAA